MRRLFACLLALSVATPALAEDEVTTFTLDNGLEIVVIEDHRAPVVVNMVWYRVGSADEPAGKSGIAHYLEHLMFKGTDELDRGEFSAIVAANGGTDNAFTSYDYTGYFQRIAADRLELMMKMEADRMVDLQLTDDDWRTERDVVNEERNQRVENSPGALFGEQRRAAQFLNHRYGVPIIGWQHEMNALTLDDALAFYDRFYAPNNAVVIVAGDVEPQEVLALAETHFGPIPANPDLQPRARSQEPQQLSERRLVFSDPRVSEPYMIRTYLAPERDSGAQEEAAALVMLSELLGGDSATSYLGRALEFDTQTAVYTSAFYDGTSLDDTTFGFVVVPTPDVSLQEAEDALDAALAQFMVDGVDTDKLERIKMQQRAALIYGKDNVQSLANRYGNALTSGLTVADVQAWPDVLQAVTPDDIMAAAENVLDRRRAVTGWLTRSEPQEVTQ
ncbi:MAG: pitrilysin family protein [Pseudomonadota bacterium]